MVNDAAQVYFDPGTPGHYQNTEGGSSYYLERGKRYKLGEWGKARGSFYGRSCYNGRM